MFQCQTKLAITLLDTRSILEGERRGGKGKRQREEEWRKRRGKWREKEKKERGGKECKWEGEGKGREGKGRKGRRGKWSEKLGRGRSQERKKEKERTRNSKKVRNREGEEGGRGREALFHHAACHCHSRPRSLQPRWPLMTSRGARVAWWGGVRGVRARAWPGREEILSCVTGL